MPSYPRPTGWNSQTTNAASPSPWCVCVKQVKSQLSLSFWSIQEFSAWLFLLILMVNRSFLCCVLMSGECV
ncbi:hypothetical protein VTL71DRAFT_568 [Oculimacula yallundae]|uniref:Uncharacterized protein n=1 Tax=Oculimacula yallundae TaxID=86028 RepID=A0ABR4D0E4_9HELO